MKHGAVTKSLLKQIYVLFLDKKNRLIAHERHQHGTVDHTPAYPREVVKRALELAAPAIILVHNHPSGDPTPSRADIEMTKQIVDAAKPLNITVHDHLIVGRQGHKSLREMRLDVSLRRFVAGSRKAAAGLLQQGPGMAWIVPLFLRYIDHCVAPAV